MSRALVQAKRTLFDNEDLSMISYFLEKSEAFHFQVCSIGAVWFYNRDQISAQ